MKTLLELKEFIREVLTEMPDYINVYNKKMDCNDDTMHDIELDSKEP